MKPSPPITNTRLDLLIRLDFKILEILFFISKDFLFLSEIIIGFFIFLVPSARLELALPKGQGF